MAFKYHERSATDWEKRATQQGGEFQGFVKDELLMWSPKKGSNWIRILPPTDADMTHYGIDVWVHYSVGPEKASVICPLKMAAEPCPICDARVSLERRNGDEDEIRELKAGRRVLVWIIDRNEEDKGPQLWAMSWTQDKDMCGIARDPRSGEIYVIDHPDHGYDLYFDKTGEKLQTKYTGYQLARKPSAVADKHLDFIQEHSLWDVLVPRSYDQIKKIFEGGVAAPTERTNVGSRRPDPLHDPEPVRRARPSEIAEDVEAAERSLALDREHLHRDEPPARPRPRPEPQPTYDDPPPRARPAPARDPEPVETRATGASRAEALKRRLAGGA